jgi:hypothetical protein
MKQTKINKYGLNEVVLNGHTFYTFRISLKDDNSTSIVLMNCKIPFKYEFNKKGISMLVINMVATDYQQIKMLVDSYAHAKMLIDIHRAKVKYSKWIPGAEIPEDPELILQHI